MTVWMAPPETPRTPFAEASAVTARGAGQFDAELSPTWTAAGKPNGGYLLALLGRAATATSARRHVLAASAHYLRAPHPGPVLIEARTLRDGRSASQVRVGLSQDGTGCVEALFTTAEVGRSEAPRWDGGVAGGPRDTDTVAREDCVRLPGRAPDGFEVPLMDQLDVRLEPASLAFAFGRPSGRGELRGWIALLDEPGFDPVSLLVAVDTFPPATFDIARSGWVPTVELTVYVRALPVPGAVRVHHRAQLVDGDLVDEATDVWDATGRLVAQARQLARVRFE